MLDAQSLAARQTDVARLEKRRGSNRPGQRSACVLKLSGASFLEERPFTQTANHPTDYFLVKKETGDLAGKKSAEHL